MKVLITTILVFFGCCTNVVILEQLVTSVPGVANLITFLQFLFIAAEGFIFTSKCGKRQSQIPIKDCALLVILFFLTSVCNNYAYNLSVPNALHIIIKSGSIVANMAMGIFFKKKVYKIEKFISASLITVGIILCTLASAQNTPVETDVNFNFLHWCMGVVLLVFALLIGAGMGLLQESLYIRCGKHSNDVLYYTHLLPLPLFMFLWNDLSNAFRLCSESSPIRLFIISMPNAWLLILGNVLTQYVCIRSVYTLTAECTSLTVTLVLTLRKFLSLVLSVLFFHNAFTFSHWMGSVFVFTGTLFFFDVFTFKKYDKLNIKSD